MSYLVTDIKSINSKKSLVYIDYEPGFALYMAELRRYNIQLQQELSEEVYQEIITLLLKRGMVRILVLLKSRDYTSKELSDKLSAGYYPSEVIECILQRVTEYGYVNDRRYTENYILGHRDRDSRNMITRKLRAKGISSDMVNQCYDELAELYDEADEDEEETELRLVRELIAKKLRKIDRSACDQSTKQKLYSYLYRKGFSFDIINKGFNEFLDNFDN